MRIVVVSALYPPNFVSGATVQAQRLARALRASGHDVRVFAGRRDEVREPLDSWTEADETGLSVTWVVTTPWLGFGDETNHANPSVEEILARSIESHPADVVHIHAMQGLGAGLARVAKLAGARVAVTMHDWWWFCARQFLVDRDLRPCCPVVDAGVCPCEVDRSWLERRRGWMSDQLSFVDLVLAPSAVAAVSLEANGVPGSMLAVNANGLPYTEAARLSAVSRTASESVRFSYTGGPHPLKGLHVVVEAARKLRGLKGWTLDLYGARDWLREHQVDLRGLAVRVLDPYASHELAEVLSRTDVLLVPSVARESHSLVTREALVAGVPVVCSDCLGPEEVVEHGRNGLVVPTGDATALAQAMGSLVSQPGLTSELAAGVGDVGVRTTEEQASELESLLSRPGVPRRTPPVSNVLFLCGIEGAPLRYRVHLPAEALSLVGVSSQVCFYTDPRASDLAERAEAIVAYRVPATPFVLDLLERARERGVPLVFDVDDLVFDPTLEVPALRHLPPDEVELWWEGVRRYRTTMEACDLYVGPTTTLCEWAAREVGLPAERFPNGVGLRMAKLSDAALYSPRRPGPPRVAYLSGTTTHDDDWLSVEPAVLRALEDVPEAELWLVGPLPSTPDAASFGGRVRRLPFVHWERLPALLRDVDVNLAPLAGETPFNEAKSAVKWLEAALVSTPTVASPTQAFREAITDDVNGLLCADPRGLTDAVVRLLTDPGEAARLGRRARRDALFGLSPHRQAARYVEVLERAVAVAGGRAGPAAPVVRDEPLRPRSIEPYELTLAHRTGDHAAPGPRLRPDRPLRVEIGAAVERIRCVDVMVTTFGGPGVELRCRLGSAEAVVEASHVQDNSWVSFEVAGSGFFEIATTSEGRIALWEDAASRPCVRVWCTPDYGVAPSPEPPPPDRRSLRAKAKLALYLLRAEGAGSLGRHTLSAVRRRIGGRSP